MSSPEGAAREPWLGLLSYTSDHQELFFGRSRETEVLLRMIRREPLTTVFGPSGTGKTSLLNAAIAPTLAREDFLPVYIRLDHNPGSVAGDRQIRARIEKEIQNRGLDVSSFAPAEDGESSWEYLHRVELWDAQNNPITPVLFFDQFEEAFTIGAGRSETAALFADLADLVENYTPASVRARLAKRGTGLSYPQMQRYKVVLSLREDFVHKLDGLRKQMPSIMQNRFPLTRMTPSQALEAVLKPGAGLVTEDVARQIVDFVADAPSSSDGDVEVEPALLSVVCRELNFQRIREETPVITSEQVSHSSADVLRDFYERSFEGVPVEARWFVEDRLLTASGFRSTAPEEDAIKAGLSVGVIRLLEDRRIIRREQRLKIAHLELTHDLLNRVVQQSRDLRYERLRHEQERRAHDEREAKLLEEREQQATQLRASRRLTAVMAVAAVLCLLLGGAAVLALLKARRAEFQARLASFAAKMASFETTRSLFDGKRSELRARQASFDATRALFEATKSKQKAQEMADQARKSADQASKSDQKAQTALRDAQVSLGRLYEERAASAYDRNDFLETWLYTLEALSTARNAGTDAPVSMGRLLLPEVRPGIDHAGSAYLSDGGKPVSSIAFTADGESLVVGRWAEANQVQLWGPTPLQWNSSKGSEVFAVAVSPDGRTVAAASTTSESDAVVDLWTTAGSPICSIHPKNAWDPERQPPDRTPLAIYEVAFSPDGMVASLGDDGSIQLWSTDAPCAALGEPITSGHDNAVNPLYSMAFSADGAILAAAAGKEILLWDVKQGPNGPVLRKRRGITADRPVYYLAFNPSYDSTPSHALAAAYDQEGLCWWDLSTSAMKRTCARERAVLPSSVAISPDRTVVISGHENNRFFIWDFTDGRLLAEIRERGSISSVAFSRDGDAVAYATDGGLVRRLRFDALVLDEEQNLKEFLRDPWSRKNHLLAQWKTAFEQALEYKMENASLAGWNADMAEAARKYVFDTVESPAAKAATTAGGAAVPEFTPSTVTLFANAADRNYGFPRWDQGELLLVPDTLKNAAAAALLHDDLAPPFIVEFEYSISNSEDPGSGWEGAPADGITFMFLKNRAEYDGVDPKGGSSRGTVGSTGYAIHFQLFGVNMYDRALFLQDGSKSNLEPGNNMDAVSRSLLSRLPDIYTDGAWRKVRIAVTRDSVDVNYAGFDVLSWKGPLNTEFKGIGFSAANGGADADHRIRNVKITIPRDSS